jgi:chromosome partitioning protein
VYIITIASTKGGVGKSTLLFNLATFLLSQGRKVAVLDSDPQGTLTKFAKVREHMIEEGENLTQLFVAAARGEALLEIANDKKQQGYIVLIDSPGVDDASMRGALLRSDAVLTPCNGSPVELWEVETLVLILKKLQTVQGRRIPLLLLFNKIPSRGTQTAIDEATHYFDQNNIYPDYVLKNTISERVAFKNSVRIGRGVVECVPSDEKAVLEVSNCSEEIMQILSNHYRKNI